MKLTGLLGGSFNPAHGGHRAVTLFALEALGLDEVWWLVSPGNPLKPKQGMAPLAAQLGSAYTIDTLRALKRRFPRRRFVWLMGADNLAQFHLWKDWRGIAAEMPIAVIARPGYDDDAVASPAMAWMRRYRLAASAFRNRDGWSAPALIELRFDPDPRSATELRRTDPDWARRFDGPPPRDGVTHSLIHEPHRGSDA